jgi:deoxycytidylate deaminase
MAIANPGTKGKFKLSACVVHKGKVVSYGINSYKTHTIMGNGHYREGQVHLHAEADALVKASRVVKPRDFHECELWVMRVKRDGGNWVEAMAKPCNGCMALAHEFGIKNIRWTGDEQCRVV